ncbi:hypothetical protein WKW79_29890 [Variovorax robiniae]|uniref:Uncharacterized protein n=1 Tax=Variovorax robiniae TaxID=1836199 RepID=A0ABU8XJG8_9BURK
MRRNVLMLCPAVKSAAIDLLLALAAVLAAAGIGIAGGSRAVGPAPARLTSEVRSDAQREFDRRADMALQIAASFACPECRE